MEGTIHVLPRAELFFRIDDCTDPWRTPTNVLMVHGFGESGEVWYAWVPHFIRHYRVIRIDQRGFGRSTPMAEDFSWSLESMAGDLEQAITQLAPSGVHLVAAKISGPAAVRLAALRPDLVRSLTLVGAPVVGPNLDAPAEMLRREGRAGFRKWADATMGLRLGDTLGEQARTWWVELMSATPISTALGFMAFVKTLDARDYLPRITCPVRVIGADTTYRSISIIEGWQRLIPGSQLIRAPDGAYHVGASHADFCAQATARFLAQVDSGQSATAS